MQCDVTCHENNSRVIFVVKLKFTYLLYQVDLGSHYEHMVGV